MSGAGIRLFLVICLLSAATFADACDEKACNVGTSVGVGACAVGSAVAGAALCAVTFGLGCALAVAAGPACGLVGEAIQGGACSSCGSGELGLEDVVNHLGGLEDIVGNGFASLEEEINHLGGEMKEWFRTLSANDKKLAEGQAKLIFMQKQGLAKLDTILDATEDLSYNLDLTQMITLYGLDISNLKNIEFKFARLEKGRFGIIKNNDRVEVFTDAALHPTDGLESSIDNVFAMMKGGHFLKRESIYEALNETFCHPEAHQYLLMQLNNALLLHATAKTMEGKTISKNLKRDFRQNVIRASHSYYRHCGCPEGYRCTPNGVISTLIPGLQDSNKTTLANMLAVNNVTDPITRNKLLLLHSIKNIEPTERVKRDVESVTVEAIELALMKNEDRHDEDILLYDNQNMCASVTKNGMDLLTANEVKNEIKQELSDLRKELQQPSFSCYRSNSVTSDGTVTYTGCYVDTTNGAMKKATGTFTVTDPGVYRLSFSGLFKAPSGAGDPRGYVSLYVDGQVKARSVENPEDSMTSYYQTTISLHILQTLERGQKVEVRWRADNGAQLTEYGDDHRTHFTGERISA